MSIINCSECGKEISDKAEVCPYCGCPLIDKEDDDERIDDTVDDTAILIVSFALTVLGVIIALIINEGVFLVVPAVMLILSIIFSIKCGGKSSVISILISGIALFMIFYLFKH